jgi:hypothetical protein
MSIVQKLRDALKRRPPSEEDLEAKAEAQRVRDELETIRVSQRSGAGSNYQSGR